LGKDQWSSGRNAPGCRISADHTCAQAFALIVQSAATPGRRQSHGGTRDERPGRRHQLRIGLRGGCAALAFRPLADAALRELEATRGHWRAPSASCATPAS
jgi:hypothetical protein